LPVWVNLRVLFDGRLAASPDGHVGWLIEQR
jgi:hypothetical protein